MAEPAEPQWLLLIHQIPPKPDYFRVKIWRRLQRMGAIAIKNSVYVLPKSDSAAEDFQWLRREIAEGGGDASICEARFVGGLSDDEVEKLFHDARDEEYGRLEGDIRQLLDRSEGGANRKAESAAPDDAGISRLKKRFAEISSVDFFGAPGREAVETLLAGLEAGTQKGMGTVGVPGKTILDLDQVRGRTWVTRKGVGVDRIASAWLIRRFIDPEAAFRFVAARGYRPETGELRFDMFDAEFTHEGERCTFEILIDRFGLADPALNRLAEVVHDIDLKDDRYGRPETAGIEGLVEGIAASHKDDEVRLERGSAAFEDLYRYFQRKRQ